MSIFGWVLHLGRCAYLDDDSHAVMSVNFVMPTGEKDLSKWKLGSNPPGFPSSDWTSTEFTQKKLVKHLYPWRWKNPEWKIFGLDKDGISIKECIFDAKFVPGYDKNLNLTPRKDDEIYPCLETEISSNTTNCESVFSADPKYAEKENKDRKSYPHIFAPLTHLPGIISNNILNLSGFLTISEKIVKELKEVKNLAYLTAFPIYEIDQIKFEPIPASTPFSIKEPIPIAECSYSGNKEDKEVNICYLQNALGIQPKFWDKDKGQVSIVEISNHQKSDFSNEAELRTYLHPIQLLSMGLGKLNQLNIELSSLEEELMTLKTSSGSDPAKIKEKEEEVKKKEEEIKAEKEFFLKLLTPESLKAIRKRIVGIFGWGWDRIDAPHIPSDNPRPNTNPHILDYFFHEEKPIAWLNGHQWFVLKNILASKKINELNDNDIKTIIASYSTILEKLKLKDWSDNLKRRIQH